MRFLIFIFLLPLFIACSESKHPDATAICDCYTLLHHIDDEDLEVIVADSCNKLYIETLKKLEKDNEEMEKFVKAYDACR